MDRLSVEDLKRTVEKILDIFKCAVCKEKVKGEVTKCKNHHWLCGECKTLLKKCPTCSEPFSTAAISKTVNEVIAALPTKCKHNCQLYVMPNGDDHEKYCGYRQTDCKLCEWQGCAKDIAEHAEQQHSNNLVSFTEDMQNMITITKAETLDQKMEIYYPCIALGEFFWTRILIDPESQKYFSQLIPIRINKQFQKLFVKIVFRSGNTKLVVRLKLDFEKDFDADGDSFSLDLKILEKFVEQGFLNSLFKVKSL
uniref:RING-type domain-containing protein n=1 Tax=Cuerna arida TaxID=1464854 RepID=A0A1B6GZ22_9HEMI